MFHKILSEAAVSRRTLLAGTAALGATAVMGPTARAANERVIFANYGGSWMEAMRTAWFEPFKKETGIDIVNASGNTLGRVQAMVEAKRTEWDLVEGTPELARLGAERNLLEPLDFKVIDRSLMAKRPEFMSDYMVPECIFGRVLTYDKKIGAISRSWNALFDVQKFPGKRTLWNKAESGILEIALMADGVAPDKLYPLDVPRALKKLGEIRQHILWFETVTQSEQYMRDGQAVMGVLADGRALSATKSNPSIEMVPEATLLTYSVFVVPKGAPNKEAVMKFLGHIYTIKAQAAIMQAYNYGSPLPKAVDELSPERRQIISGVAAGDKAVFLNAEWWGKNLEATTEKFQQWMLG
ncbi:MAG: ABC transporter substrate-binding protein [Pseudorhodoplanes sp.]